MATSADQALSDEMLDAPYISAATPWSRFWSRHLDLAIWTLPAAIILEILLFYPLEMILPPIAVRILINLAIFPVAFVLDAICLARFGQTPARNIAGIRVTKRDGTPLTFSESVKRNFSLFYRGMALGLPLISLFTLISAFEKVKHGKQTSWDMKYNTMVVSEDGCIERTSIVAFLYIALIALLTWIKHQ